MQPIQIKMARAALGLSVDQLASEAGLSHVEIARLESGEAGDDADTARLKAVFEQAGIQFIGDDAVRASVQPADGTIPVEELNSYNDE